MFLAGNVILNYLSGDLTLLLLIIPDYASHHCWFAFNKGVIIELSGQDNAFAVLALRLNSFSTSCEHLGRFCFAKSFHR